MRLFAFILATLLATSIGAASDPARAILGDWHIEWMAATDERRYAPIRLRFTMRQGRGSVAGLGGCNAVVRAYEIKNGAIVLHGLLRATRRYCGARPQKIQGLVSRILGHGTGWSLTGGQLVLQGKDGAVVARFGRRIPNFQGRTKRDDFSFTMPPK